MSFPVISHTVRRRHSRSTLGARGRRGRASVWIVFSAAVICAGFVGLLRAAAADKKDKQPAPEQAELSAEDRAVRRAALEEFNSLIGGWRGMGQIRRGSNRGAWQETAEWVWQLKTAEPALKYQVEQGRHLKSALLTYAPDEKQFRLTVTLPDDTKRRYTGELDKKKLILQSTAAQDGTVHRITITRLNEKRTLVLFQKRRPKRKTFSRVAEVGYTRKGTKLARSGSGTPECIVTGGKGTSTIEYKGKTYYLCCSGCREVFQDDPEAVLAEAAARAKKKAAED